MDTNTNSEKEVNISYETLFEILRIEKDKEELQKLNDTFFVDVIAYLRSKDISLISAAPETKRKLDDELENIKKILKDLYERREKKIVSLALDVSRTKSNLIDKSGLLNEEKELFDALISLLDNGRDNILKKIIESGDLGFKAPETAEEKEAEETKPEEPAQEPEVKAEEDEPETAAPEIPSTENKEEENATKMIRFVSAVPKFVGKELEEYGPFEGEDVANLPAKIAKVLIEKGRAEEIEQG
jgi:DNA replication initiation complex subunit (GINS family)